MRSRGKGLLGSLRSRPEYEAVLEAARAHGVPFGKAKHSHMGFVEGEAMRREGVEHANPMLPVYVELLRGKTVLQVTVGGGIVFALGVWLGGLG